MELKLRWSTRPYSCSRRSGCIRLRWREFFDLRNWLATMTLHQHDGRWGRRAPGRQPQVAAVFPRPIRLAPVPWILPTGKQDSSGIPMFLSVGEPRYAEN